MNAARSGFRMFNAAKRHAHHIDEQGADEVLQDDRAAAACDPHRLHELEEIVSKKDDIGGFTRDLRPRAHPDPDERFGEAGASLIRHPPSRPSCPTPGGA